MRSRKKVFERVSLKTLASLGLAVEQQPTVKPEQMQNVQKRAARPKRNIRREGEDHPVGLWIDRDLLRKHQNRTPRIVVQDPLASLNNRYLALADVALRSNKAKQEGK